MGSLKKPQDKKLIVGFIYNSGDTLLKTELLLIKKFGPIDIRSEEFDFSHTAYYEKEMGSGLKRKFAGFGHLIPAEKIWKAKLFTNRLEQKFSRNNARAINIDPGYINLSKLVLFTTKDYTHRLYLGGGIFGEVTLQFRDGSFAPFEYTYPDYKTSEYIKFFNTVRDLYKLGLTRK